MRRLFTVTENPIARKLLPPMVHVTISPGQSPDGRAMWSVEYDTVSDRYARFLMEEVRPEGRLEDSNVYPFKVRKEPKRNIRVWMSDRADDLENDHGSWPMQNIQMANSLKLKEYDFHFRFGTAAHGGAQAGLDLPESLARLWRDYDAKKTAQAFRIEPGEKEKPLFRVTISNRDPW
jgi:hypothetical protein